MAFRTALVCALFLIFAANAENLRYVQAIWRHGDRAPGGLPYPEDIYGEETWPRGWNQLTNLGMGQMMELGQYFRKTYTANNHTFVLPQFNATEVYVLSTDVDRALTSAQSMLSGFFPPTGNSVWNSELNWQPIPVHAYGPGEPNPLLKPTAFHCPTYNKLTKEINHGLYNQMIANNTEFIEFLKNHTGIPESKQLLKNILHLYDINREIAHNLTQPRWINQQWSQYGGNTTLQIITELKRRHRWSEFQDSKLAVLRGGFLLGDFLSRAKAVVENRRNESADMFLYSSHDGTLSAFLSVMNVSDWQLIPYASCVIMEIVEDNGEFYAKLSYRKNKVVLPLTVPGCKEHRCIFSEFYDALSPNAIFDRKTLDEKCGLSSADSLVNKGSATRSTGLMSVLGMLTLLSVLW